jgi:hypothetical protein
MNTALTLIGLVGLSTILAVAGRVVLLNRAFRFYRFRYSEPADVVLTTDSDVLQRGGSGLPGDRVKTQLGYLRGLAYITTAISRTHASKQLKVHVSDGLDERLTGDLIVLGGTGGNFVARRMVDYVVAECGPVLGYDESDESRNTAFVGDIEVTFDWLEWSASGDDLTDFAVILFWVNPFLGRRRRAIWCSGFTATGTMAACAYIDESLPKRWRRVRKERGIKWTAWPCFALLLAIDFNDDAGYDFTEMAWQPLTLPRLPLAGHGHQSRGRFWSVTKRANT